MYDSTTEKVYGKDVNFNIGEEWAGEYDDIHEYLPWSELKETIENRLKKIKEKYGEEKEVLWIEGDNGIEPDPKNTSFYDFCSSIFSDEFSYDEAGTSTYECDIKESDCDEELFQKKVDIIISKATEKVFVDFVAFILNGLNDNNSASEYNNNEKKNWENEVVATTGLSLKDEAWVKEQVESKGGTFKKRFAKKITCLVVNPDYDHETTKLLKTKDPY